MRQQVMKENGQLSDAMDCGFYVHGPRFLWPVSNPGFYNMAYAGSGITSVGGISDCVQQWI